jgi:surfactin synthase thioesterase subunit
VHFCLVESVLSVIQKYTKEAQTLSLTLTGLFLFTHDNMLPGWLQWVSARGGAGTQITPVDLPEGSVRLVCFSWAGSSAAVWTPFIDSLRKNEEYASKIQIIVAERPGRGRLMMESGAGLTFDHLVDMYVKALREIPGGRIFLWGHSFGALIAFEVATRIAADPTVGHQLGLLFVSGRRHPSWKTSETPVKVSALADKDLVDYIAGMGGLPDALRDDPNSWPIFLPATRLDYGIIERHDFVPKRTRLPCPITCMVGKEDGPNSLETAQGWGDEAAPGKFQLEAFPGGHFFITSERDAVANLVFGSILAEAASLTEHCIDISRKSEEDKTTRKQSSTAGTTSTTTTRGAGGCCTVM